MIEVSSVYMKLNVNLSVLCLNMVVSESVMKNMNYLLLLDQSDTIWCHSNWIELPADLHPEGINVSIDDIEWGPF